MDKKSDDLESLLACSPPKLETWLDESSIGGPIEEVAFNWQLFAFSIASQATNERSSAKAHIALRVYEQLASHALDADAFPLMFSAMNLRAWMIRELGPHAGDAVLDPELVVTWFRQVVTLSLEEARQHVSRADLRPIPIKTLRLLRRIKNALSALALIPERALLHAHPDLEEWLRLRAQLP